MDDAIAFADRAGLRAWLEAHHGTARELLVRIAKAGSGVASVTWEDCVVEAIRVGWIDGVKKGAGPEAWVQRLTPRRKGSAWSERNRGHAERLIATGEMAEAGLREVEAARADGRWDAAYAGPSGLVIPEDFLAALETRPAAKATFEGLNRQNLYAIYYRLHTAKRPETRAKRMAALLATLEAGGRFH
ncbi:hypothetical protein Rumeso_01006 [Rubellimicrobium mesophilum DSM 19309]|uniref:Periplasmic membrane protein n=1 Tax=Rubellimicrobium mesophilum DSM 19309 TaxID=442562 RepID=A0A017HU67_9RHOB|nr:YdeI/OmpD-associated family protein [Rubellimicrobium mesophilum]EYD77299.1 hypothetical protein Rumeso_01006 [Rubellimicrobium mesophilum DSM 19309]